MSVRQAQREISASEFIFWVAYMRYHTLDTEGWQQASMIAATIANSVGVRISADKFMPVDVLPQTPKEMEEELARVFNG